MSALDQSEPAGSTPPPPRPIFIVGFPRSGTTLLQALLGAHPRIAGPPEMHFFRRIPMLREYWGDLKDDDVLRRVIHETVNPPTHRLQHCGFEADRIFERARHRERTFATVLDTVMHDFAERQGKTRWCEKTPLQPAAQIWRHFPQAQVLHIIRDPRPTVASGMAKLGVWPSAAVAAKVWLNFTLGAVQEGAGRGPSHYLRLRYEDLALDPESVLRIVFSFLEEDFDPTVLTDLERRRHAVPEMSTPWMAQALQPVAPPDDSGWRSTLSWHDRLRVAGIVGPVLPALGYPPPQARTHAAGVLVNAAHSPAERFRLARLKRRAGRPRTPEQRYQESINEQLERDRTSFERMTETLAKTAER